MDTKKIQAVIADEGNGTSSIHYPNGFGDEGGEDREMLSNDFQTSFERYSDDFRTSSERLPNDFRTNIERESDDVPTMRQRQTMAATEERCDAPAINPEDYVTLYANVVKYLTNRRFVKQHTGRSTLKYVFSVPRPLQKAINAEIGEEITPSMYGKIRTSQMYMRRYSPAAFWSVVLVAVVVIFAVIRYKGTPNSSPTPVVATSTITTTTTDIEATIAEFERTNHFTFYPYRKSVIRKEIKSGGDPNEILQKNMSAQIAATQKGGAK